MSILPEINPANRPAGLKALPDQRQNYFKIAFGLNRVGAIYRKSDVFA